MSQTLFPIPNASSVPAVRLPGGLSLNDLEVRIQEINRENLVPLAKSFGYRLGRKSEAIGLPTVLILGNHSSGKSSFINYLFEKEIQKTGVAPTDDGFTLIRHAEQATEFDGKATVIRPDLPFRDLEQFGPVFLSHLKLKLRPSEVLKNLMLIDSPGMIDAAIGRDRGYDFIGVVRHFAETADLILFFFDPDKPGTTGESLQAFTESLSGVAHKLLIVMNKVDLFPNIRDFARAYGALTWNLAHVIKTKDLPHIFCTYIETAAAEGRQDRVPLEDFKDSRKEIVAEIHRAPERRADNLVTGVYDSARKLQAHARVAVAVGALHRWRVLVSIGVTALILAISWLAFSYAGKDSPLFYAAMVGLGLALASVWLGRMTIKHLHARTLANLDPLFWAAYQRERAQQKDSADLQGLWDSVKPGLVQHLQRTRPSKLPSRVLHMSQLGKLDKLIEQDVPELRRSLQTGQG